MSQKKVTILCGASGSGKTTWADKQYAFLVSADKYFYGQFNARELPKAHAQCLREFVNLITTSHGHVIVDNTNTTIVEIAPYYALAEAYGYEVEILIFSGEYKNVHGVPERTVVGMRDKVRKLYALVPRRWRITPHKIGDSI